MVCNLKTENIAINVTHQLVHISEQLVKGDNPSRFTVGRVVVVVHYERPVSN